MGNGLIKEKREHFLIAFVEIAIHLMSLLFTHGNT